MFVAKYPFEQKKKEEKNEVVCRIVIVFSAGLFELSVHCTTIREYNCLTGSRTAYLVFSDSAC